MARICFTMLFCNFKHNMFVWWTIKCIVIIELFISAFVLYQIDDILYNNDLVRSEWDSHPRYSGQLQVSKKGLYQIEVFFVKSDVFTIMQVQSVTTYFIIQLLYNINMVIYSLILTNSIVNYITCLKINNYTF